MTGQCLSLAELAERWGVSASTVLAHVYSGHLRAIDLSTNPSRKSRYVVPLAAVEAFEADRTVPPPEIATKRERRVRVRLNDVIEFIA